MTLRYHQCRVLKKSSTRYQQTSLSMYRKEFQVCMITMKGFSFLLKLLSILKTDGHSTKGHLPFLLSCRLRGHSETQTHDSRSRWIYPHSKDTSFFGSGLGEFWCKSGLQLDMISVCLHWAHWGAHEAISALTGFCDYSLRAEGHQDAMLVPLGAVTELSFRQNYTHHLSQPVFELII